MKKVSIIYWTGSGHVHAMADAIAVGAEEQGAQVNLKFVSDALVEDVESADIVAFGCPSMDENNIEQSEFQPYIVEFKRKPVDGKKAFLFGSYGWDKGEWMEKWSKMMTNYGFDVIGTYTVKERATHQQLKECVEIGQRLVEECSLVKV